jgi:hypothetical protein
VSFARHSTLPARREADQVVERVSAEAAERGQLMVVYGQGDTEQLMDCVIDAEAELEAEDLQDVKAGKKTMKAYLKEHEKK